MRIKFLIASWSHDPLFEVQQPPNGQKLAIDSTAKIDQHKILSLFVHNKMGFGRETNSHFILGSRDTFFERQ